MSDERLEAARAEAERFVDKEFPAHGWSASFRQYAANVYVDGVRWADDNPQPTTITREELDAFKRAWNEADQRGEAGGRVEAGLRAIGIRVEEDDRGGV